MFALRPDGNLFRNKYVLYKAGEQYWALFTNGSIMALETPSYDFKWPTITEEQLKDSWPAIWKTYKRHQFLWENQNG